MSRLKIKDIGTAVKIYYESPELDNQNIMDLFGCSRSAALNLKKIAVKEQEQNGIKTFSDCTVNTACAYRAWNIDISDLEKRFNRYQKMKRRIE